MVNPSHLVVNGLVAHLVMPDMAHGGLCLI